MDEYLVSLVEQSIPHGVSRHLAEELRCELHDHIESRLRELALEGISRERAVSIIISSFGKTFMIQEQFRRIHWFSGLRGHLRSFGIFFLMYLGLQFVLSFFILYNDRAAPSDLMPMLAMAAFYPFTSLFFIVTPLFWGSMMLAGLAYLLLKKLVYIFFPQDERPVRALVAVAFTVAGFWLSLRLSETPYVATAVDRQHVYALGGFPFTAVAYSYSLGPNTSSLLLIALNMLVWFALGIAVGFAFPRRGILPKYVVGVALVIITAFALTGGLYFAFQFD